MIHSILKDKPTKLFINIAAFFVANALIAECIGGKIFSLEKVFGMSPSNFTIFGQSGLAFNLTSGALFNSSQVQFFCIPVVVFATFILA